MRGIWFLFRIGTGNSPTWVKLVGVEEFDFPDQTPDNEDVTHLESPGDTEEAILGMKKAVTWSLNLHYVPGSTTDTALSGVEATRETFLLGLKAVGATEVQFSAYLNSYRPTGINAKGKMMAVATFTVLAKVGS